MSAKKDDDLKDTEEPAQEIEVKEIKKLKDVYSVKVHSNGLTNVQKKILEALSDGRPHTPQDLFKCLSDEMGSPATVAVHITGIRKKLRPKGQDISCETINRQAYYRHVRLLSSHYGE